MLRCVGSARIRAPRLVRLLLCLGTNRDHLDQSSDHRHFSKQFAQILLEKIPPASPSLTLLVIAVEGIITCGCGAYGGNDLAILICRSMYNVAFPEATNINLYLCPYYDNLTRHFVQKNRAAMMVIITSCHRCFPIWLTARSCMKYGLHCAR